MTKIITRPVRGRRVGGQPRQRARYRPGRPSGLDGDSGQAFDPAIMAATTLTLALPKAGLLRPAARDWAGDLYLADISVPVQVYQRLGIETGPVFAASDIVPVPLDASGEPA